MSVRIDSPPECLDCATTPSIASIIDARPRDLGGFVVRRLLPAAARRMVGPFIFFDHAGPTRLPPGAGIDIRPHPHIGLATVSYLFEGAILHRDSLGSEQRIRPGDLALMTAGRGITHSERTPADLRSDGAPVHALQLWVALPLAEEECEPRFEHHPAETLPTISHPGAQLRLLMGDAYGERSPVRTLSPLFYVDARLCAGSELVLPPEHEQRAIYVVEGAVHCGRERVEPGRMLVFHPGSDVMLCAEVDARLVLIGGAPLPEARYIDWNFVSSSKAHIEQAKRDWQQGRFPLVPGDESEFTPLPG